MSNSGHEVPSFFKLLVLGSRPRTLPAAVVPVFVGAASVANIGTEHWWRVGLAIVVSVSLQIAVNYANDYSDGVRGTDDNRVGPLRLVGSGLVAPRVVKNAAIAMLGVAAVAGVVLASVSSWWIIAIGAAAMLAAWTYTGGPRPYGYAGLGEVFVFVFFGVVATVGSEFVIENQITLVAAVASVAVGCFACALLVVNNLRDLRGDRDVGKVTLAVRMGDTNSRYFFCGLFVVAAVSVISVAVVAGAWPLLGLAGFVFVIPAARAVLGGAEGRDLVVVLGQVGRAQLLFGVFFSAGLLLAL